MKGNLQGIFPIPIYFFKLERNFLKNETNIFNEEKLIKNVSNKVSNNSYMLENKNLSKLKKEILIYVNEYFKNVISTKNKITPIITQSWINFTSKGEKHHSHHHNNSIVSGVLYIKADKNLDSITFVKDKDFSTILEFSIDKYNAFNSKVWSFPVETGDIILFPSYLSHKVETKKDDNLRVSLAFNVFVKGTIGKKYELTELNL